MKKRTFLKLSSGALAASVLGTRMSWAQNEKLHNWAGNYVYSTSRLDSPRSLSELMTLVKKYRKFKVLGTRHCFNGIADSTDQFISLAQLDLPMVIEPGSKTVSVGAAVRYGQLAEFLHKNGFALHNLASLPHISVAGACATATHGSGNMNGNLSTAVSAMEFLDASGEPVSLSREKNGDQFPGAVVNLGAIGVVTKLSLDIQPDYMVRQDVYENLPFGELEQNFDKIMGAGYSVSLFTDWTNHQFSEVWVKRRVPEGNPLKAETDFYGAKPATRNLHPIIALSAENCTEQMGVPGPWHERLPHFRMGFTPSSGKELQSEYFVPREHAYEAIMAVAELQPRITPHLLITEIRTIDADQLWMSPCYRRPSTTIHFTWKQDWPAVKQVLPLIEAKLARFDVRPHWGKLFTIPAATLKSRYEKLGDFIGLAAHYDPGGKFRNAFLRSTLYGS